MANKVEKLTTNQICNVLKLNTNNRAYIEHKYKKKEYSLKEWKSNLEKDGLSLS